MNAKLINIFVLSFAAGLLGSCSGVDNPEVAGSGKGCELVFTVAEQSRASVADDNNFRGSNFVVYGDMKFPGIEPIVVFNNTAVRFIGGRWVYDNKQYWFPKHEHSFVAVYPAGATGVSDMDYSDSRLKFDYTAPGDYKSAQDLMVATHRRILPEDELLGSVDPVRLGFFHILSRIDFKLINNKAADFVKVTEIKLTRINRTGSYAIVPASVPTGSEQTDDYIMTWSNIANKGTLTANLDVRIPEDETGSVFPDNDALFVVPQPDNKEVGMQITYELWDDGQKFEEHTRTASAPIGGWESGKVYTYSLTVSEITKEIYLTVSVKNWQGLNNSSGIKVPEN